MGIGAFPFVGGAIVVQSLLGLIAHLGQTTVCDTSKAAVDRGCHLVNPLLIGIGPPEGILGPRDFDRDLGIGSVAVKSRGPHKGHLSQHAAAQRGGRKRGLIGEGSAFHHSYHLVLAYFEHAVEIGGAIEHFDCLGHRPRNGLLVEHHAFVVGSGPATFHKHEAIQVPPVFT